MAVDVRPDVFLDVGGVIIDGRQRATQWPLLVGEFFESALGGTAPAWAEANRAVTERLGDLPPVRAAADRDFLSFHRTYQREWIRGMAAFLRLPLPRDEECIALAYRAIAHIAPRVRAALPGAVEAIRALHRRGYRLHTASGAFSGEVAGYLDGMGVGRCFGRVYGSDLINTFKHGPEYYARIFAHAGVEPTRALVVDDSWEAIVWAGEAGARTVWAGASSQTVGGAVARVEGIAELPAFLQQVAHSPASCV
jgi:HAD superfamily hydrolase (TIGR01509 family)